MEKRLRLSYEIIFFFSFSTYHQHQWYPVNIGIHIHLSAVSIDKQLFMYKTWMRVWSFFLYDSTNIKLLFMAISWFSICE